MRKFNTGIFDRLIGMPERGSRHPWPEDCHIQGGGDGLVLNSGLLEEALTKPETGLQVIAGAMGAPVAVPHYRTAFFEAFPKNPATFIRGEGPTLEAAEDEAWRQFQKALGCTEHDFQRGTYRTGAGICKKCGLFKSKAFPTTLEPCVVCRRDDNQASHGTDRYGHWHCAACFALIPEENKSEIHKMTDRMRAERQL